MYLVLFPPLMLLFQRGSFLALSKLFDEMILERLAQGFSFSGGQFEDVIVRY